MQAVKLIEALNDDKITKLDSSHFRLEFTREELRNLGNALKLCQSVKSIELENMEFNSNINELLGEPLPFNECVKHLKISHILNLSNYVDGLRKVLQFSTSIEQFTLNNQPDVDNIIFGLGNTLVNNIRIKELYLTNINIKNSGYKVITNIIKYNKTITTLDISHHQTNRDLFVSAFGCLDKNESLKSLSLNNMSICGTSLQVLSSALEKNQKLTTLNFTHNDFKGKRLLPLIYLLREEVHTIENIDLSNSSLDNDTAVEIAKKFELNPQLESLNFSQNNINNLGVTIIARYAQSLKSLKLLDLSGNAIDKLGAYFAEKALNVSGAEIKL